MPDCGICGREIRRDDHLTTRDFYSAADLDCQPLEAAAESGDLDSRALWVHIACTADGVERWCRAGRPYDSPLEWVRKAGINWTGLDRPGYRGGMVIDGP